MVKHTPVKQISGISIKPNRSIAVKETKTRNDEFIDVFPLERWDELIAGLPPSTKFSFNNRRKYTKAENKKFVETQRFAYPAGIEEMTNKPSQRGEHKLGEISENANLSSLTDGTESDIPSHSSTKVEGKKESAVSDKKLEKGECTEGVQRIVCEGDITNTGDTQAPNDKAGDTLSPIERLQRMLADSKSKFGQDEKENESGYDVSAIREACAERGDGKIAVQSLPSEVSLTDLLSDRRNATKEGNEKKKDQKAPDNASQSYEANINHLMLPKDLVNEIKELDAIGQTGVAKVKGVSYKDMLLGANTKGRVNYEKEPILNGFEQHREPVIESAKSSSKLKYYAIESEVVELEPEKEMLDKWGKYLVGYFVGARLRFLDVKQEMLRLWKGLKDVICTEKGFYFLEFSNEKAMLEMVEEGFCHVFGRVMVVRKWQQMLQLSKEEMDKVPIWVRLYDLPVEFWSVDNISRVASKLGRPLYMDQATEFKTRLSFARVCVEINAKKELQSYVKIKYRGEIVEVGVEYQWVPFICDICNTFGHKKSSCKLQPQKESTKSVNARRAGMQHKYYGPRKYVNQEWKHKEMIRENIEDAENMWTATNDKRKNMKIKDRHGNVSNVRDIKSKNSSFGKGIEPIHMGNSFGVLAAMEKNDRKTYIEKNKTEPIKVLGDEISQEGAAQRKEKTSNNSSSTLSGLATEGVNSIEVMDAVESKKISQKEEGETKEERVVEEGSGLEKGSDMGILDEVGGSKDDMSVNTEENIVSNITPAKLPFGLSEEDYPKDWSKKKVKKEIKATRNAMEAVERKKGRNLRPR